MRFKGSFTLERSWAQQRLQ